MSLTTLINKNFRIQISQKGLYRNYLVGAGQYHKYIESQTLAEKHFNKALKSKEDRIVFKLRRGLTSRFYSK